MSSSTTKIELVTEAIEALVLAQTAALLRAPKSHDDITDDVLKLAVDLTDARDNLKYALKEMLTPTLRVITGEPQQSAPVVEFPGGTASRA